MPAVARAARKTMNREDRESRGGHEVKTTRLTGCVFLIVLSLGAVACNGSKTDKPEGNDYNPSIDPAHFVAAIDNPYMPLVPGTTFTYRSNSIAEPESIVVTVTDGRRTVLGVSCVVVDDRVWVNSELVEATFDWYAQDDSPNVWYFGEDSRSYEGGVVVSTEGSWEADVDDAKPGIVMRGSPGVGDAYRQEYLQGEAEDMAEVLGLTESVAVPYGSYVNCLKTREWTPLEPGFEEHKYYAPGVGLVLTASGQGDQAREELVSVTHR
jgi:hypothetical protein